MLSDLRSGLALGLLGLSLVACEPRAGERLDRAERMIEAGYARLAIETLAPLLADQPSHSEANYLVGVALVEAGEPSLAVWSLDRASRSDPEAIAAHRLLARLLLVRGEATRARLAADRALAAVRDDPAARLLSARALLAAARAEEALGVLGAIDAQVAPEAAESLEIRALALEQLERYDAAGEAWRALRSRTAEGNDPDRAVAACAQLARFLDDRGEAESTARLLSQCREEFPDEPALHVWLGRSHRRGGHAQAAEAAYRRALELRPDSLSLAAELASLLEAQGRDSEGVELLRASAEALDSAEGWADLAAHARARGAYELALESLERAIARAPASRGPYRLALADLLLEGGDLARAREVGRRIEEPEIRALVEGAIALHSGDPETALARLEQGIAEWPGNAGARFMAGEAAQRLGDLERAIVEYREALRLAPGATLAASRLAEIYRARGDAALALETLAFEERARPHGPPSRQRAEVAYQASALARMLSRVDEEVIWLERSLAQAPDFAPAANDLAWRLSEGKGKGKVGGESEGEGDLDRALRLAHVAVAGLPSAETHDTLASVHLRRGESAAAIEHYERALALDPRREDIRAALERVRASAK